jgi:hypothetical protein
MLVAFRLAGLSALEAHNADLIAPTQSGVSAMIASSMASRSTELAQDGGQTRPKATPSSRRYGLKLVTAGAQNAPMRRGHVEGRIYRQGGGCGIRALRTGARHRPQQCPRHDGIGV